MRILTAAYWILPSLFCLILYWHGLGAWFRADDFAWLNLSASVDNWRDLWEAIFSFKAQGTIRPLSERGFFILFDKLFGWNALPFRICVFLTQVANLVLISSITTRLTGSRLAGFLAPIFWTANNTLAVVMAWNSAYNQALCAFFLLLAFHFLLKYIETGEPRYNAWQWATFLVGFGALETNAVYPIIAASYTFLCARKYFRRTLPLFIPSLVFVVVHRLTAPPPDLALYVMHFDAAMLRTLGTYWLWSLGPTRLPMYYVFPALAAAAAAVILTAGLLGLVAWQTARKKFLPLFLLLWFVITLAPVLPLRDHITEYYPFIPTIGLCMLGATAFSIRVSLRASAIATVLAAIYLAASIPITHLATKWFYTRSQEARKLVQGVVRARELHPGKAILLDGVNANLFGNAVLDQPFRGLGIQDVYLTPGSESAIGIRPEFGDVADFVLPPDPTLRALNSDKVVVYSVTGERLRNITSSYEQSAPARLARRTPRRVDAGNPLMEHLLGPTWYPRDNTHRWMPGQATVRLGGPRTAAEKLYLTGHCPSAPIQLRVTADGFPLSPGMARSSEFTLEFAFPPSLVGKESVELSISVNRTIRPPSDGRELGLAFGIFEVR